MLNKPDFYLTSHKGDGGKDTVFDLPVLKNVPFKLNTVGRLDYRTEGLLLLSNDGAFIHHLTHPKYKMPRHYYALVNQKLSKDQEAEIKKGITLDDGKTGLVDIRHAQRMNLGKSQGSWYYLTVHEGRNRLVRRIFEHFDIKVVRLIRFGFGDLRLPEDLKPGEYRQLSSEEIAKLKKESQQI
ncbi:23S rRNA pseudouridine2605 synthase [Pseudobacteriovorax antillogorgiicola]|uniref:Pseudouridine synthase n=2 Tax=Pseudobacteriovorax antillogorgiicola TaxID=1513793 RepID=A0A1Y6B818_9BACT|nr:23S rRNA pseudouridine2605 synthase [Pseudobacteriovorax antillogorgiicola]SME90060.1 23S rRNA pseudouridine2605 synthase [Pseudobacteriovorax antillogorgiicola]